MPVRKHLTRYLAAIAVLLAGAGCATSPPSRTAFAPSEAACSTAQAAIYFDFEGASLSRCSVDGERAFSIVIAPEHAPPINPSPWYAFRYEAQRGAPISVRLTYLGAEHRYIPKLSDASGTSELAVELNEERDVATLALPARDGTVSAQPLLGQAHYETILTRLAARADTRRFALGRSHDGRPVEALHYGDADAPELIVLLGRAHPPEVTGASAMEPFVETLIARLADSPAATGRFQVLAVPLLNPDGVARGHWRANLGGTDLNRDWGHFTQPETSAVHRWLEALPSGVRPVIMLDFHSTQRNLFYVQGDEANEAQQGFLSRWLVGKEERFPGYAFTIERRNANTGAGTSKNWFYATYDIPAYTYEVGDTADEAATRHAARQLAVDLVEDLVSRD